VRDLRDPQKLGEWLQAESKRVNSETHGWPAPGPWVPMSRIADYAEGMDVPNYPQDESMATVTARQYREELSAAAAAGDIYAASMLKGLPYDEPGDAT
jgi:hypothetical protein